MKRIFQVEDSSKSILKLFAELYDHVHGIEITLESAYSVEEIIINKGLEVYMSKVLL